MHYVTKFMIKDYNDTLDQDFLFTVMVSLEKLNL